MHASQRENFLMNWKRQTTAAFKKGEKHDKSNYRPVSILSILSKFMKNVFINNYKILQRIYSLILNVASEKVLMDNNVL